MKGPDKPSHREEEEMLKTKNKPKGGLTRTPLCPPQAGTVSVPITPGTVRPQELSVRALNS